MTAHLTHPVARLPRQLATLGFDIGAPIVLYYVLHGAGVSNLMALAAGVVLPTLGATYTLLTRRQADTIAVFMIATMLASIVISAIAHGPRFLLAKDGLITGLWGLWFLASVRAQRPAAFIFARPLMENMKIFAGRSWDALWDTEPQFRRIWRVSSVMWGVGLLVDAVARMAMSYTLPIHVVPGLNGALYPVTFVVLQLVTNIYYGLAGLNRILGARWPNRHPGADIVSPDGHLLRRAWAKLDVYSKPLLSPELAASAHAAPDQLQQKPSRRNTRSRGGGSR